MGRTSSKYRKVTQDSKENTKKRFASQPRGMITNNPGLNALMAGPRPPKGKKKKGHNVLPNLPPVRVVQKQTLTATLHNRVTEPNVSQFNRRSSNRKSKRRRVSSAISSSTMKSGRSIDSATSRSFGAPRRTNLTNQSLNIRRSSRNKIRLNESHINEGFEKQDIHHSKYIKNVMNIPHSNLIARPPGQPSREQNQFVIQNSFVNLNMGRPIYPNAVVQGQADIVLGGKNFGRYSEHRIDVNGIE